MIGVYKVMDTTELDTQKNQINDAGASKKERKENVLTTTTTTAAAKISLGI